MKFLKSMAMTFPFSLVTYPCVMVPVAILHGAAFMFGAVLKNLGWWVFAPLAGVSVLRSAKPNDDWHKVIPAAAGIASAAVGSLMCAAFLTSESHNATDQAIADWLSRHLYIVLGLGATNLFSGLYELGRWYANTMGGAKASQSDEAPDAKVIAPQSYGTMISKIMSRDKWSQEEAGTLIVEVGENVKNDRMKLNDAKDALNMISSRAPTAAVVH